MLAKSYTCPDCARECSLDEAINLSRGTGRLNEACTIKCPKCGTQFEITARRIEEEPPEAEPEPEAEKVDTPPEKPTTPPPETEKKKEESVAGWVVQCVDCLHEQLSAPKAMHYSCNKCGSSRYTTLTESAEQRLEECFKQVAAGVNPVEAVNLFLG